ncbi:MAG: hypothetical protein KDA55_09650 [Planctomycetales bacterium]|nr:hypothetical protein [Planctomycetales bacterium]
MSFEIVCNSCFSTIRAAENLRGKHVACPRCKSPIAVPTAEVSDGELAADDLVAGEIPLEGGGDVGDWDQLIGLEQSAQVAIGLDEQQGPAGDEVERKIESYLGRKVEASVSIPAHLLPNIRRGLRLLFFTAVLQLVTIVLASIGVGLFWAAAEMAVIELASQAPKMMAPDAELAKPEPSPLLAMAAVTATVAVVVQLIAAAAYSILVPVDLTGTYFCLWLPSEKSCRKMIQWSLIVKLIGPVVVVLSLLLLLVSPWFLILTVALAVGTLAAAWTLTMLGLQRFATFLQRQELMDEGLQLMITGLCLIAGGVIVPGAVLGMLLGGHWAMVLTIFVCITIACGYLFRHAPLEFLVNGFMYGTGAGFVMRYGNFLSALHHVRTKVTR